MWSSTAQKLPIRLYLLERDLPNTKVDKVEQKEFLHLDAGPN